VFSQKNYYFKENYFSFINIKERYNFVEIEISESEFDKEKSLTWNLSEYRREEKY